MDFSGKACALVVFVVAGTSVCHAQDQTRGRPAWSIASQYPIEIIAVDPPLLVPGQAVTIRFRLSNKATTPTSGEVSGDIDGQKLITGRTINDLQPGASTEGSLSAGAIPPGQHVITVRYAVTVLTSAPEVTPAGIKLKSVTVVLSSDTAGVYSIAPQAFLSSSDHRDEPPPVSEDFCGSENADFPDPNVLAEWKEIIQDEIVPAVGTVIESHEAARDLPFSHPFDKDFNFEIRPDKNWEDLLARGNRPESCSPDSVQANKSDADVCNDMSLEKSMGEAPVGVLINEVEAPLVPEEYRPRAKDRVLVYGHWVVDCGHHDHHNEIHPPVLIAAARIDVNQELRSTLIAPAFRTRESYMPDQQPLLPHLLGIITANQVFQVPAALTAVPKVETTTFAQPFVATYRLAFLVPPRNLLARWVRLAYFFDRRPGVDIKVLREGPFHVTITVIMDPTTYSAPPPPDCSPANYSLEDIDDQAGWPRGTLRSGLNAGLTNPLVLGLKNIGLSLIGLASPNPGPDPGSIGALNAGVQTQKCIAPTPPDAVDRGEAMIHDPDPSLAFPVVGWVHMSWTTEKPVEPMHGPAHP